MTNFDEKSGIVPCPTEWGSWWQTIDEVTIEVNIPEGTTAKQINCMITPSKLKVTVMNKVILDVSYISILYHSETTLYINTET